MVKYVQLRLLACLNVYIKQVERRICNNFLIPEYQRGLSSHSDFGPPPIPAPAPEDLLVTYSVVEKSNRTKLVLNVTWIQSNLLYVALSQL